MPALRRSLPLAATATLLVAIPAASQQNQVPETQVWIDVATHHMAGMPDLGPLGGLAGRMMGGGRDNRLYPTAIHASGTGGQYLDIALHNTLRPGVEAAAEIPGDLRLGRSIPLMPPEVTASTLPRGEDSPVPPGEMRDGQFTLLEYWGCGATVRSGQPKRTSVRVRNGKIDITGSASNALNAPRHDISATPAFALWPNRKHGRAVPEGASLAGSHRITGEGVPASLAYELGQAADFMPKIALDVRGTPAEAQHLRWQAVDHAKAYFLHAGGMAGQDTMVTWSSAEVAGAGQGLVQYLDGNQIGQWLSRKVLLPPTATECTIPAGIFAGNDNTGQPSVAMLGMIAYGPETHLVWPPKPADPKQPWDPEWSVRVRTKSTVGAMLGMDFSGMQGTPASPGNTNDAQPQPEEGKGKRLLRGLLRNL